MKKSLWYISKYASPLKYGFSSRHFNLGREFKKLGISTTIIASDSNHLCKFPCFDSIYTQEFIDEIETWWVKTIKYKGTASFRRILSWLDFEIKLLLMPKNKLEKPDIIIVSSLSLLTVLSGYWLKRKYGCKLIFEVRDIWPLTIIEEGGYSHRNPFVMILSCIEKFGYNKADIVVGTMPNLISHVNDITGKPTNCHCIPFGFDPALYESTVSLPEGYEEHYIPKNKFIVGYGGSIGITNALDTLIQCASEMQDNERVHFLLFGDGDLLSKYREQTYGMKNISFAPKVDKAQVRMVLRHCQVLYFSVMDSLVWRYGLSLNKLIDYMMAGKPIIASYSGYPSMLNEAECGVFVPSQDVSSLITAINEYEQLSDEQLNTIGERGRKWLLVNRPYEKIAIEYSKLF